MSELDVPHTLRLASRTAGMKPSAVREILKVAERPDIVSFAGGLPAAELFPVVEIAAAHAEVFAHEGPAALQYSVTEGFGPLRDWVAARLARRGIPCDAGRVIITAGSQQGIDLVAKVLLDPGDEVVVESPSYLAALQSFAGFEASCVAVSSDDQGMDVAAVERVLATRRPKLIYVVPEFQNPKGTTLSRERRVRLASLARAHDVLVLEDDPYGELRYAGEGSPPVAACDDGRHVIYLGTFSKTLAPGLRLGWLVAPPELHQTLVMAKQAADLHSSTLSQRAIARLLSTFDYDGHVARLRSTYGARCAAMVAALERYFPSGTRFTRPEGGLFVWVELPGGIAGEDLLEDALRQRVAFVPGAPFFATHPRHDFIRLNFSNRPIGVIDAGVRSIARALDERLGLSSGRAPGAPPRQHDLP